MEFAKAKLLQVHGISTNSTLCAAVNRLCLLITPLLCSHTQPWAASTSQMSRHIGILCPVGTLILMFWSFIAVRHNDC